MGLSMRIDKIDFLRFLGLSLIILAHVQPPLWLSQLRNFDVPLMFMVMGMSFYITKQRHQSKLDYTISRFRRLVIPTWIFLALFFTVNESIALILNLKGFTYNPIDIARAFALSLGFGYVWVIRLFFIISVIAILLPPQIYNIKFYLLLPLFVIVMLINSHLKQTYMEIDTLNNIALMGGYISNAIPYMFTFIIGYKLIESQKRQALYIAVMSALLFAIIAAYSIVTSGLFNPTQSDKYPPGIYYMSYALFMSTAIYLASEKIVNILRSTFVWNFIGFVSQNSIWTYLWHIPFIFMCLKIKTNFLTSYVITFVGAVTIVYIQVKIVKLITGKIHNKSTIKIISSIFTG